MKTETLTPRHSTDKVAIDKVHEMARTATHAALNAMQKHGHPAEENDHRISLSTCAVAMLCQLTDVMGYLDRDAAADTLELMAVSIRPGASLTPAQKQLMFKAQQQLAHSEIAQQARLSSRGTA